VSSPPAHLAKSTTARVLGGSAGDHLHVVGLLTDGSSSQGVGGEVLAYVW